MLNIFRFLIISMIGLWMLSSCGDSTPYLGPEPDRPAIPIYPNLSFLDTTGVLTKDAFVLPGDTFRVRVNGEKGDSLLTTLSLKANNLVIDTDRVMVNENPISSSAIKITNADQNAFVWDIDIVAQQDSSKVIYEFKLEDKTGRTDFLDILINTKITAYAPPIIELLGQSDTLVLTSESVSFDLTMDAIGSPIKSIAVYQGAELVTPDRLKLGGVPFDNNPLELSAIDREGFSKAIEIVSDEFPGRQGFSVEFLDSLDNKFYAELSLVAIRRVVLQEDVSLAWNQALRLTTGIQSNIGATKVTDEENTDLKDVSKASSTWDQTIMATNQSRLKKINPDQDLNFDAIKGENVVRAAWSGSLDFTSQILVKDTIKDISPITNNDTILYREAFYPVSDRLSPDDLYIASDGVYYFLIKVKTIDDNSNSYVFDIKY